MKKLQPVNNLVNPMLTDQYQLSMAWASFAKKRHNYPAVFEAFFRRCPFGGEFAIFGGLEEYLRFLDNFHFTENDIRYLRDGLIATKKQLRAEFAYGLDNGTIKKVGRRGREKYYQTLYDSFGEPFAQEVSYPQTDLCVASPLPDASPAFFDWLLNLNLSKVEIQAAPEGSLVFANEPIIRVSGPLAVCQILETATLVLHNYPTLAMTNAARLRLATGADKGLAEFGLRRAQGPDGAVTGARAMLLGGFNGTSNVAAGQKYGFTALGTMAHSYIESYFDINDVGNHNLNDAAGQKHDFVSMALNIRESLGFNRTHLGELAAFISYAQARPNNFLALVDTYDTQKSGVPNYLCVALALTKLGYQAKGVRIDSGDLALEAIGARQQFVHVAAQTGIDVSRHNISISNDIDEKAIRTINQQTDEINTFSVGTHGITCKDQPALGMVYKLVEFRGRPRIKISGTVSKRTLPGAKQVYRLYDKDKKPLADIIFTLAEAPPQVGQDCVYRSHLDESLTGHINIDLVVPLQKLIWKGRRKYPLIPLSNIKKNIEEQLARLPESHWRDQKPVPYPVRISPALFELTQRLLQAASINNNLE